MFCKNSDLWPNEAVRDLCEAWSQGMSTREIALVLTLRYGHRQRTFTKNMVVGKVHRLHLEPRTNPIRGVTARPPKLPPALPYKRRSRQVDRTIFILWDLTQIVAWPDVWDDVGDWPPVPAVAPAAKVARSEGGRRHTARRVVPSIFAVPENAVPTTPDSDAPTVHGLSEPPPFMRSKVIPLVLPESGERSRCRFPIGEPKKPDFHFCGKQKIDKKSPYCNEHHAICYQRRWIPRNDAA